MFKTYIKTICSFNISARIDLVLYVTEIDDGGILITRETWFTPQKAISFSVFNLVLNVLIHLRKLQIGKYS